MEAVVHVHVLELQWQPLWFNREDVGVWRSSSEGEFSLRFWLRAFFREDHSPFYRFLRLQRVFSRRSRME